MKKATIAPLTPSPKAHRDAGQLKDDPVVEELAGKKPASGTMRPAAAPCRRKE